MSLIQGIILGIVQGLTEFIPVSSSGHLVIFPYLLGWPEQPLSFDTTLHLGTALALIIYFYKDLLKIVLSFINDLKVNRFSFSKYNDDSRMGLFIIVATIPAGVFGVLFGNLLEDSFRTPSWVALFMIVGSLLMTLAERLDDGSSQKINYVSSLKIGFYQVLALFPGFSRSGATISGGMLSGLNREDAARFSFLLSVPVILLAGFSQLAKMVIHKEAGPVGIEVIAAGFITSALSGYIAIGFLMKFLKQHQLDIFIYYRIILAVAILLLLR